MGCSFNYLFLIFITSSIVTWGLYLIIFRLWKKHKDSLNYRVIKQLIIKSLVLCLGFYALLLIISVGKHWIYNYNIEQDIKRISQDFQLYKPQYVPPGYKRMTLKYVSEESKYNPDTVTNLYIVDECNYSIKQSSIHKDKHSFLEMLNNNEIIATSSGRLEHRKVKGEPGIKISVVNGDKPRKFGAIQFVKENTLIKISGSLLCSEKNSNIELEVMKMAESMVPVE